MSGRPSDGLLDDARSIQDDMVRLRRTVHSRPEVGLDLPYTQEAVLNALDGLGLEISTGRRLGSVTAVLRGARPGPTVLLRGAGRRHLHAPGPSVLHAPSGRPSSRTRRT